MKQIKYLTLLMVILAVMSTSLGVKAQDVLDDTDNNIPEEHESIEHNHDIENNSELEEPEETLIDEEETIQINDKQELMPEAQTAPDDWAFDESSKPLHDALVHQYGEEIDLNRDGYISIEEANAYTGIIDWPYENTTGTMNGIEHFKNITWLDLYHNQLTGTIPESIGNLTKVTYLDLSSNQLSGSIPESIGNLTNLNNLYLDSNQLTGIPLKIHSFLKSVYFSIANQKKDLILDHVGATYKNYSFEVYPAYTEFPMFDEWSPFNYSLKYPDGIDVEIMPILKDNMLTVSGKDLTQAGMYVLTAKAGTSYYPNATYTTTFTVDKGEVDYLQLESNGEANKETTDTLIITVGGLDAEDVKLSLIAPKENEIITKGTVTEVGDGVYAVAVSGQWEEGREVKVELVENDNVRYTPSERTTVLHTIDTYTLSFDSQNGSDVEKQFIEYGKPALEPSNPTKAGHTFAGWYTDTTWTQGWDFDTDVVTDNLILYAKWDVNQYDVYFKVDNDTVIEQLKLDYGSLIEKPADPQREGYVFAGWYKDTALTQEWDFNKDTVSGVTFLYAKWNLNEYDVHFVTDNGVDLPSIKVNHGGMLKAPELLTKEGYTFGGWYTDTSWTQAWDFEKDIVTANLTLYAKWDVIQYDVHFVTDNGVDLPAVQVNHGGSLTEPQPLTKEGHTFAGWYTDTSWTQGWDFDTNVVTANLTLYAKWNLNEYEVHFVTDNGVDLPSIQVNHGETFDAPAPLTKTGHTFGGWYTDTSWTQAWDFDTDVVTDNLTLYARWEPIDPLTHVIEADDVELTISDVLEFDEERFLQLTNATIKRNDAPSLFSMVDTLGVLEHNIVAEPGEYYAVIAAQANADVQTEVKVTVVADNPDAGSEAGKSEDNVNDTESMLPQTGIESSLRGLELLILGGFLLFWNRRRKEMQ